MSNQHTNNDSDADDNANDNDYTTNSNSNRNRYLRDASPLERRRAVEQLPTDKFLELITYMDNK